MKWANAKKATKASEEALESLQLEQILKIYSAARTALNNDLEEEIAYYANALSNKRSQKMTKEDKVKITSNNPFSNCN